MASPLSVLKKVIPLNCVHVEGWETVTRQVERYGEAFEVDEIRVHARPFKRQQCLCPECMRRCERDGHRQEGESAWRAPDLAGGGATYDLVELRVPRFNDQPSFTLHAATALLLAGRITIQGQDARPQGASRSAKYSESGARLRILAPEGLVVVERSQALCDDLGRRQKPA